MAFWDLNAAHLARYPAFWPHDKWMSITQNAQTEQLVNTPDPAGMGGLQQGALLPAGEESQRVCSLASCCQVIEDLKSMHMAIATFSRYDGHLHHTALVSEVSF